MEKGWMDPEEVRWFQSLEMPAVIETARQDGLREFLRGFRAGAIEKFNLDWIKWLHALGEKLDAIHYVLDLPKWEVGKILEGLDSKGERVDLFGRSRDVSLIIRLHRKGRAIVEISDLLDIPEFQVSEIIEVDAGMHPYPN